MTISQTVIEELQDFVKTHPDRDTIQTYSEWMNEITENFDYSEEEILPHVRTIMGYDL